MTESTHLAHGLRGDLVAADWPPLGDAEVSAVLGRLGLASGRVTWRSPRPFSAAAVVSTQHGAVFVKRHHRLVRAPADLAVEHALSRHVSRRGIRTPEVLGTLQDGDWTYEVHTAVRGRDVYRDALSWSAFRSREHARGAGRALAAFHRASSEFSWPARPAAILVGSWDVLRRPELWSEGRLAQVRPLLEAVGARDLPELLDRLPPVWTHNDWHASNLTWRDGEVDEVFDFGLANLTTAAFDLAVAIERNTIGWLSLLEGLPARVHVGQVDELLRGYEEVQPLAPLERTAVARLAPVAHVDFALSEVEYFDRVVHNPASARLAWDSYLVGHLRWWAAPAARRLVRRLERWGSG